MKFFMIYEENVEVLIGDDFSFATAFSCAESLDELIVDCESVDYRLVDDENKSWRIRVGAWVPEELA